MRRRDFIAGLGAMGWSLEAGAQQRAVPVIGLLSQDTLETTRERMGSFRRGLAETGYFEGRNVAIEYRWARGENRQLPALANDLVRRQVDVIVTPGGTPPALAAKAATQTIPIVFEFGSDPVEFGLVTSLSRPGSNITGITILAAETRAKRLQLLHELLPAVDLIAVLVNPTNPSTAAETAELESAARILSVRLLILNASKESDIEAAFATLVREQAGALAVAGDAFLFTHRDQIIALTVRNATPAMSAFREFATAGGLMAYGTDVQDAWRLAGNYTGRILNGEKPSNLPVQQATKIQLVINMRTAKTLGLTIPEALLATANEVIE
jgi:putative tryptophan/tyrosine transport system substrate-binding protein